MKFANEVNVKLKSLEEQHLTMQKMFEEATKDKDCLLYTSRCV